MERTKSNFVRGNKLEVYISNLAFALGMIIFVYLLIKPLPKRESVAFLIIVIMFYLLLLNAVVSVRLSSAGKLAVVKGILAFIPCLVCTPVVGRSVQLLWDNLILENFLAVIFHGITVMVLILPIIGMRRKTKLRKYQATQSEARPS
jgi:hypothetical protein